MKQRKLDRVEAKKITAHDPSFFTTGSSLTICTQLRYVLSCLKQRGLRIYGVKFAAQRGLQITCYEDDVYNAKKDYPQYDPLSLRDFFNEVLCRTNGDYRRGATALVNWTGTPSKEEVLLHLGRKRKKAKLAPMPPSTTPLVYFGTLSHD